ncbi:hypothetical protein ABZ729_29440 [Streptomyces sp. NPDC006678]|uniref:hypothetical protein n=1 Tax=Streptomyces sp. NPDC006678 TaxID=3157185 RepID=UPI0033E61D97
MDAQQVNDAFATTGQQYARTPCRSCRNRDTDAVIAYGTVLVTCNRCGTATSKGPVHKALASVNPHNHNQETTP